MLETDVTHGEDADIRTLILGLFTFFVVVYVTPFEIERMLKLFEIVSLQMFNQGWKIRN